MAGSPALAQEATDEGTSAKTDIIVTAQRRSERLEDVPMSVAALSADALSAAGVTSVRDIGKVVTGVQLGQAGGLPQPAVRGITTLTNGVNFENNVAVYVDGFYEPAPQAINIDLPNVSGIQVLKGPQGTLYGRNATGGAILLNTIDPDDAWKGRAELTYGRFDDKRASGFIAGPLNDMIGVSLAGYVRRSDGYVKFSDFTTPGETAGNAAPNKQDAWRAKVNIGLSDTLTVKLAYNYTRVNDPRFSYFSPIENVPTARNIPSRPTRLGVVAANYPAFLSSKSHQATMIIELETGIGDLTSYTGKTWTKLENRFDFDGSYTNGTAASYASTDNNQDTFQQAIDLSVTAIDRMDLVIGATYFQDKITPESNVFGTSTSWNGPGLTQPIQPRFQGLTPASLSVGIQDKKAWAVYADATYEVVDKLFFNIGGRYSSEKQDLLVSTECILPAAQCPATAIAVNGKLYTFVPTTGNFKYNQFTPRAGLRYELGSRTNIYATYSKGFRPGAVPTSLAGLTPATWLPIKSETVDAFEIGYKTVGDKFRLEFAAFMYEFTNLQTSATQLLGTPPTATVVLSNAPKAKVKGLEGSFEFYPIDNFTVRGGAAYLHARYGAFPNAGGTGVNPTVAPGITVSSNPLFNYLNQNQVQDWTGLQMARAPDITANLGVEYSIPVRDGGLKFNGHANYTSSYVATNPSIWCQPLASNGNCGDLTPSTTDDIPVDVRRKQRFRQNGYVMLSASATWTEPNGNYYVQIYGNNLTDRKIKQHYTGTAGGTYIPLAEPLTYGARIGYKF